MKKLSIIIMLILCALPAFSLPSERPITGVGDDVVEFMPPNYAYYMHIEGNSAGRHFAVWGYDDYGETTELFVNTTDPYSGNVIDPSQNTSLLEISADGAWSISFVPLIDARTIGKGQKISGNGDDVIYVESINKVARISGQCKGNFAIWSYGDGADLLVNEIGYYSGRVLIKNNPVCLAISADGPWSIEF